MKQLDLCSGVGAGFPLAALQIGDFELVGLAEIDDYCSNILSLRFPEVPNFGDVRILSLEKNFCDIITASPACQPFTLEGKRLASTDERDCIPYVLKIARNIKPKYLVIENVPGLLSSPLIPGGERGSYFRRILSQLDAIGYDAEWEITGTSQFGTPWQGKRLLLVAASRSLKLPWSRATSWGKQIRMHGEETWIDCSKSSLQSRVAGDSVRAADGVDIPVGVPSGDGVNRDRRAAIGNALDPRLAKLALHRVLYLNSLQSN